jgi:hypothetical protein
VCEGAGEARQVTTISVEAIFLSARRWRLEEHLRQAGHRWDIAAGDRRPRSAAEHLALALARTEHLGKEGQLLGEAAYVEAEVEHAARWAGQPGLLWKALVATGWVTPACESRCARWSAHRVACGAREVARQLGRRGGLASARKRALRAPEPRDLRGRYCAAKRRTPATVLLPNRVPSSRRLPGDGRKPDPLVPDRRDVRSSADVAPENPPRDTSPGSIGALVREIERLTR